MTLHAKQVLFARLLSRLIQAAESMGYEITLGEVWRPDAMAAIYAKQGLGIANSLHRKRLAADVNLFVGGVYLTKSEDYRKLGEWWEQQNPMCRWGGRFSKPDGNHYSIEHEGVR